MRVNIQVRNQTTLFFLDGDLDMYSAPEVRKVILAKIREGARKIFLVLDKVFYIDSSGVGVLIRLLQEIKIVKGELKFIGIRQGPKKVLQLSNLFQILQTCDSLDEAFGAKGELNKQ